MSEQTEPDTFVVYESTAENLRVGALVETVSVVVEELVDRKIAELRDEIIGYLGKLDEQDRALEQFLLRLGATWMPVPGAGDE